jgi:hypothetical protein
VKRNATWVEAGLALVLLCIVLSVYAEHSRGQSEGKLATLHTHTVVAETLYAGTKVERGKALTVYRTVRDTLLSHTTDTLVRQVLAKADTVIAKDSAALRAADAVIAAKNAELVEALKPKYAKRLSYSVAALYDPLSTGALSASAQASLRVVAGLSLIARADQRAAIGERPRAYAGVSLTF